MNFDTLGGVSMKYYVLFFLSLFFFITSCCCNYSIFLLILSYLPIFLLNFYKYRSKNFYIILFSSLLYFLLGKYVSAYLLLFGYTVFSFVYVKINNHLIEKKNECFENKNHLFSEEDNTSFFKTLFAPFLITLIFVFCIFFNFRVHAIEYGIMIFFIVFFDFDKSFRIFESYVIYYLSLKDIDIFQFSKFLDLAKVTNFVFSKTGVLTLGNLSVTEVLAEDKKNEKKLIEVLAYAEHFSNNRIGKCIHEYCFNLVKVNEKKISEYQDFKNGVSVLVSKKKYLVGNYEFMVEQGIEVEKCMEVGTNLYVSVDKKFIGVITISDQISMKVKRELEAIKKLRPVHFTTFSKDNGRITRAVSNTVGIYDCYSEVTLKKREYWISYLKDIYKEPQAYITDEETNYLFDIRIGYGPLHSNNFDIIIRSKDFSKLTILYQYSLKVSSYKRTWSLLGIFMKFVLFFLLLWIRDILIIGGLLVSTIIVSLCILIGITFYDRKGVSNEKNR